MIELSQIRFSPDADFSESALRLAAARVAGLPDGSVRACRLLKKSLDARRKDDIHFICSILVEVDGVEDAVLAGMQWPHAAVYRQYIYSPPVIPAGLSPGRPLVVGSGPAGLFAALTLARAGVPPLLIERGREVEKRSRDVDAFFSGGPLDVESNVQFGEGGAGTFSDGKLTTGTKDERIQAVLDAFAQAGAPEEILYLAKPHIGTDRLKTVVRGLRDEIIRLGGEVRFESRLTDVLIENGVLHGAVVAGPSGTRTIDCASLILACGHSARDTFEMLSSRGVPMAAKAFSVGARIEHAQTDIDRAQYGRMAGRLPAAEYKMSTRLTGGRGVYTFCMCPGGSVVAAASEAGSVVTNGMSRHARDGQNANSALLVGVTPDDFGEDPLAGVRFQRSIERAAYAIGGYRAPAQLVGDFLRGTPTTRLGGIVPTYTPGVTPCDLAACLPPFVIQGMRVALADMERRLRGFSRVDAVLTAPETRSSSPVRVLRGEDMQSIGARGLFPCGEGAGYAGGIVSAAVDGIRCAEAVLAKLGALVY